MAKISCSDTDWKLLLAEALRRGRPVELRDLNYTQDGPDCESLAAETRMDMVFVAQQHLARFTPYPRR